MTAISSASSPPKALPSSTLADTTADERAVLTSAAMSERNGGSAANGHGLRVQHQRAVRAAEGLLQEMERVQRRRVEQDSSRPGEARLARDVTVAGAHGALLLGEPHQFAL